MAWIEKTAASGDAPQARSLAAKALARTTLRFSIERAEIDLAAATLDRDNSRRMVALRELARQTPADITSLRALADAEMNARRFPEAAQFFSQITKIDASNADARNMLGYAEALGGNLDAARKTFIEYARDPNQALNSVDSLGEAQFINGKFAEAEQSFLEVYKKDPNFLEGAPLWKAAHARWLTGDLRGADDMANRYVEARAKVHDPLALWRKANWLYETGRGEQAIALLRTSQDPIARKQLEAWQNLNSLPRDPVVLRQTYERTPPASDGLVRTLYAAALLQAGQKDEARKLVQRWPLPEGSDSYFQAIMYPRFLELRQALQ